MHQMHWPQTGDRLLHENAPKQELDIINEIDLYIAWPGQALAYKRQLKIKELRGRAGREWGQSLNLREFRRWCGLGTVPLDVLERNVVEWIAKKSKSLN